MNDFSMRRLYAEITVDGTTHHVSGCPISINVTTAFGQSSGLAQIQIVGMPYNLMEALTWVPILGTPNPRNCISVYTGAGELVFVGDTVTSSADFNAQPDVTFNISAMPCAHARVKKDPPLAISPKGEKVELAKIAEAVAKEEGKYFVNNGVTDKVSGYFDSGSRYNQLEEMCKNQGVLLDMSASGNTMYISKPDKIQSSATLNLSSSNGMIGYPVLSQSGLEVRSIYNPQIELHTIVFIDSIVPKIKASGSGWVIIKVSHKLSSGNPSNGQWETQFTAMPVNVKG